MTHRKHIDLHIDGLQGSTSKHCTPPIDAQRPQAGSVARITGNLLQEASSHRLPITGDLSWTSPSSANGVILLVRSSCAACGGSYDAGRGTASTPHRLDGTADVPGVSPVCLAVEPRGVAGRPLRRLCRVFVL